MSYIECMILGLINQGYRYGHELDKVIEDRQLRLWTKINRASIYQTLIRLNNKGWVEANIEKIGKNPERTVYSLTELGKKALKEMILEGLSAKQYMEFDISIPVSFLSVISPNEAANHLMNRKVLIEQALNEFPLIDEHCEIHLPKKANLKLLRGYYELELQWLEWLINELEKKSNEQE